MPNNVEVIKAQDIYLFTNPGSYFSNPIAYASKNDWGRAIRAYVMEEPGCPYEFPDGTIAELTFRRSDNYQGLSFDININPDGTLDVRLTREITSIPGDCLCNIFLMHNGDRVGLQNFTLHVEDC